MTAKDDLAYAGRYFADELAGVARNCGKGVEKYLIPCVGYIAEIPDLNGEENNKKVFQLVGALKRELYDMDMKQKLFVTMLYRVTDHDELLKMFVCRSAERAIFVTILLKEIENLRPDIQIRSLHNLKIEEVKKE